MKEHRALDVSPLPTVVFGHRAPIWWGVVGLIAIETTAFAVLAVTYLYLRGGALEWPPPGVRQPSLWLTTANLLVLLGSLAPMLLADRAAKMSDLRRVARWLSAGTLLGLLALLLRAFELDGLSYRWSDHAFGSVVWVTMGLHTAHLIAGSAENLLFLALLWRGPVEDKHLTDLQMNSLYWSFAALSWLPFYALFFLDPALFR